MKQYFEKQINDSREVEQEDLGKLQGQSIYGRKYDIGDQVLFFLEQVKCDNPSEGFDESFVMETKNITYKELDNLSDTHKFIRMSSESIPVLEKI